MSKKSINFDDKSNLYKNKKLFKIDDIDANKILVSEKEPMTQKSQLNTSLGMMIMMLLDHHV